MFHQLSMIYSFCLAAYNHAVAANTGRPFLSLSREGFRKEDKAFMVFIEGRRYAKKCEKMTRYEMQDASSSSFMTEMQSWRKTDSKLELW
jgi:hypothetical protein